ncbi:hypothetical protein JCM5296_000128 [Sporobolomyces johnsonii]
MPSRLRVLLIFVTVFCFLASLYHDATIAVAAPSRAVERRQAPRDLGPARLGEGATKGPSNAIESETRAGGSVEGGKTGGGGGARRTRRKTFKKRCYYVGTFFQRIDCNAAANSTSVPYSHAPAGPRPTLSVA